MSLTQVAAGVWAAEGKVRFFGQRLTTRMTVLRLAGGGLFVHSPIGIDGNLRAELDPLGPVRFVVAPSKYHHLSVAGWRREYPAATLYAAPGLPEKRPDLEFDALLSEGAPAEWAGEIEQLVFWSLPVFNEVVFFHRPSRSLLVADLVFNIHEHPSRVTRGVLRLDGMWRRFGPSRLTKLAVRDRARAREAIQRILRWDFDRVIMTHGRILETGGHVAIRDAYAFL